MEKYRLGTEDLDAQIDPIVASLFKKVVKKGIAVDEQHKRFSDLIELIKSPTFTRKESTLPLKRLRIWSESATKWIDRIAKQLAKQVSEDASEQGMALSCFRPQLRATLISRLILIKAEDGRNKWAKAMKIAAVVGGTAAGITAVAICAAKVVKHMRRDEDGARPLKKAKEELAEEKRKQEERDRKKEEQSPPS